MKRIFVMLCFLIMITGCNNTKKELSLADYEMLSFEDLNEKIKSGEPFAVYAGWLSSEESINFEINYLFPETENFPALKNLYIINLENELPMGKDNPDSMSILDKNFGIHSAPFFLYYKDGKLFNLLSWSEAVADKKTGIYRTLLDDFFLDIGFLN